MVVLLTIVCEVKVTSCAEFGEIKVLSFRGLLSSDGYVYVVFGEIYNSANKFVKNVKIEVALLNSQGETIAKINASSSLSIIPSKRRSPFVGYYWGANRNLVWKVSINKIVYEYSDQRPRILAFSYRSYFNGSLTVHVLNNYTLVVGQGPVDVIRNATNNIKVVAALYLQDRIVGVSAGFLNLDDPGLLPDMDTSEEGRPPISVDFAYPFNETEVALADKVVASVESRDFVAQYHLIGLIKDRQVKEDGWIQVYEELLNNGKDGNETSWRWESIFTLIILSTIVVIVLLLSKKREGTKHAKKRLRMTGKNIVKALRSVLYPIILPSRTLVKVFWAACNYTGRGAELVKVIPVLLMAIAIFYPAWSFPIYLWLSLQYGYPLNYILYFLWIGQIIVLTVIVAYIDRTRKSGGS